MSRPAKKLIVILGPTASGKSDLAIKLAEKFHGEIVSADSRQIYKEMDIGTAKPTIKQRKAIPHHLIDIIKPNQEFTLADYKETAVKKINQIQKKNKIPFLVGGTGLYIQAIIDNLDIPKVKPDKKMRAKLEELTAGRLLGKLQKLDPKTAKTIDPHNKRRLIRAVEVCLLTNKPFSQQRKKGKKLFNVLQIGVKLNKKTLDQKINQRVDKMFERGLVNEVKKLIEKYSPDLPASNAKRSFAGWPALSGIGYQEIIKNPDLEKAKDLIKLHTRQYAKRQMTWFKRDKRIKWVKDYQETEKLVKKFLEY